MEGRHINRDLLSLGLLVLVVLLAMSLVSYDPADNLARVWPGLSHLYPVDPLVYPGNDKIQNACGLLGAIAADALYSALGYAAIYVVLSLAVLCYWLLSGADWRHWFGRGLGWAISLVGLTSVLSLLFPHLSPGPLTGGGGYVGMMSAAGLLQHFNFPGGIVLAVGALVIGTLMWTDYVLLRSLGSAAVAGTSLGRPMLQRMERRWKRLRSRDSGPEIGRVNGAGRRVDESAVEAILDPDQRGTDAAGAHAWGDDARYSPAVIIGGKRRGKRVRPSTADDAEKPTRGDSLSAAEAAEATWVDDREDLEGADDETMLLVKTPKLAETPRSSDGKWEDLDDETVEDEETELVKVAARRLADGLVKKDGKRASKQEERQAAISEIEQRIEIQDHDSSLDDYELPSLELLATGDGVDYAEQETEVRRKARLLEQTFKEFGFNIKVTEIETGPVIAQYELALETGLRLSKIMSLADDLAIALRVPSVRIVAPIPGKNTVGVEVPNEVRQIVRLRDVIEESSEKTKKMKIPIFLGKDVSGNPMAADLAALPHLLIAGRTGTGKSVCLNAIISSILMTRRPEEVRLLMIDPKMVELSGYSRLPHLMHPVVTDMKKAEAILAWAVDKMEERYSLLAQAGVRHLVNFNQLGAEEIHRRLGAESDEEREAIPTNLPFIVIIADEMADLMMTAGKTVEQYIIRLAQKSRAVGIHLILATQKPTVDVITGLIKSNLPARIAFQVASKTDSRVVLDENGADKLLGNGDMLFLGPGTSILSRGQGTYLSDDEIEAIVESCASAGKQDFVTELVNLKVKQDDEGRGDPGGGDDHGDDLYHSAVEAVIREQRGSVSMLQRIFKIGYGRAARLVDFMAEDGVVGPYNGKIREVVMTMEQWRRKCGESSDEGQDDHSNAGAIGPNRIRLHTDHRPSARDLDPSDPSDPSDPTPTKLPRDRNRSPVEADDTDDRFEETEWEDVE